MKTICLVVVHVAKLIALQLARVDGFKKVGSRAGTKCSKYEILLSSEYLPRVLSMAIFLEIPVVLAAIIVYGGPVALGSAAIDLFRGKPARPPAWALRRAVRFLTTAKGFREVFEPTFADMDEEYFEALSRNERFEAWKIAIAYHWKVGMLIAMRPVVRALATVMGWMKAG